MTAMSDRALYRDREGNRVYKTGSSLAAMRQGGFPFADSAPIAVTSSEGSRVPLERCRGCGRSWAVVNGGPSHDAAKCVGVHDAPPYCPGAPRTLKPRKASQAEMLKMLPAWVPREETQDD